MRYGRYFLSEPLSTTAPETPWATFTFAPEAKYLFGARHFYKTHAGFLILNDDTLLSKQNLMRRVQETLLVLHVWYVIRGVHGTYSEKDMLIFVGDEERTTWASLSLSYILILIWVRRNGCPWDKNNSIAAACRGHVDVFRWAMRPCRSRYKYMAPRILTTRVASFHVPSLVPCRDELLPQRPRRHRTSNTRSSCQYVRHLVLHADEFRQDLNKAQNNFDFFRGIR